MLDHLKTMTPREFGEITQLSPITVHRMIKRGDIPAIRAVKNGPWRIRVKDIEAWMDIHADRNVAHHVQPNQAA